MKPLDVALWRRLDELGELQVSQATRIVEHYRPEEVRAALRRLVARGRATERRRDNGRGRPYVYEPARR